MKYLVFSSATVLLIFMALGTTPVCGQSSDSRAIFDEPWSLDYEQKMVERMEEGIGRYFDRYNTRVTDERSTYWNRDLRSPSGYVESVAENRARFRTIVGLHENDQRVPVEMERFGDEGDSPVVAETAAYVIEQVRWPVLDGVRGEGLLLTPKTQISGRVVALPDADQLPEQIAGLSESTATTPFALHLAANGQQVLIPTLISRSDTFSTIDRAVPRNPYRGDASPVTLDTDQSHREWIYRQAYVNGRHVIGMELHKILAGIDWFEQQAGGRETPIGVAGYGEGGLLALYAAAVDRRIDASLVSGYFGPREQLWREPLYRNIWGLLEEFGDAEIASLIAPRSLVVEYSQHPDLAGAPGTPSFENILAEAERTRSFFAGGDISSPVELVHRDREPVERAGSKEALGRFSEALGMSSFEPAESNPTDRREHFSALERQEEQVHQLTDFFHDLLDTQDRVRYEHMEGDWSGPEAWHESMAPYRKEFREDIIGRVDQALLPANPRLRKVYDREEWVGYEVVLDVWPDVFAWGVLAVPKDLEPDEKRPTVVVQHGAGGTPSTPIRVDSYNNVLPRLAERGFVVFAPHNPYSFNVRKATPLKASVFSVIIPQYRQIVDWLETREHVDPERIGFYGKSWGGRTALRVPTYIEEFKLSISSAYFNQWPRKAMTVNYRNTYMQTGSIGVYEWNMGPTFGHAEMVMLQAPGPFMVESGFSDAVAAHEWVGYEFAKVKRLYELLGVGHRAVLGFHIGGHEVHGDTVFPFIHKHLNWPVPPTR